MCGPASQTTMIYVSAHRSDGKSDERARTVVMIDREPHVAGSRVIRAQFPKATDGSHQYVYLRGPCKATRKPKAKRNTRCKIPIDTTEYSNRMIIYSSQYTQLFAHRRSQLSVSRELPTATPYLTSTQTLAYCVRGTDTISVIGLREISSLVCRQSSHHTRAADSAHASRLSTQNRLCTLYRRAIAPTAHALVGLHTSLCSFFQWLF